MSQTVTAKMKLDIDGLSKAARRLGMLVKTNTYVTLYGGKTEKCDLVVAPSWSKYSIGFNKDGTVIYDHMITSDLTKLMSEYYGNEIITKINGKFSITKSYRVGTKLKMELSR